MTGRAEWPLDELVAGVGAGDERAVARAISLVEDGAPLGDAVLRAVYGRTGRAAIVGLTGAPGAGKSTLLGALVRHLRAAALSVGVVSVDPSSARTRGALLGDRIRLAEHFLDRDVFIRSMGTRGHAGGVAAATLRAVHLLDAAGKDVVVVETVGVGQSEIDVAGVAEVVVLVVLPGAGDSVQALKAGIMEVPDVIAVTKSDLPASAAALADVLDAVGLEPDPDRRPRVLAVSGITGDGVDALWEAIAEARERLRAEGGLDERRRRIAGSEVVRLAGARFRKRLEAAIVEDAGMEELIRAVERRELDPASAAERLLEATIIRGEHGRAVDR